MESNAPDATKIPGLFLSAKFVPTHLYKKISKSFALAKISFTK